MTGNNLPNLTQDSDPDLKSIFMAIWDGRWIIVGFIFAALILAIFTLLYFPSKITAQLEFRNITLAQAAQYDRLNSVARDGANGKTKVFGVGRGTLTNLLIEDLLLRKSFIEAIKKNTIFEPFEDETKQEFESRLINEAYGVKLISPVELGNKTELPVAQVLRNWNIKFEGYDEDKIRSMLFDAINISTQNVKSNLVDRYNLLITKEENRIKESIADIDRAVEISFEKYNRNKQRRIAFLKEQAGIARTLDIRKNTIEARPLNSVETIVAIESKQAVPFYFQGYEAIEKEMTLIEGRKNISDFVPGLADLEIQKLRINTNPMLTRLMAAYQDSPLVLGEFKAVNFEKFSTQIERSKSKYIVALMIFVLFFILSLATIGIRRVVGSNS